MRIRRWVISGMLALCLPAMAAEHHVGAGYAYATLEELRTAPGGVLQPGDIVTLHNNDDSLTAPLNWADFTIRSAGDNRFTISSKPAGAVFTEAVNVYGANPSLTVDSVRIDGTNGRSYAVAVVSNAPAGGLGGSLTMTDSIVEKNGLTGIVLENIADANFTNTQIIGTGTALSLNNSAPAGEIVDLDIVFDSRAGLFSVWDGQLLVNGDADIGFNIADGKFLTLGGMTGQYALGIGGSADLVTMTKTGGGTLRVGGAEDMNYSDLNQSGAVGRLDIQEGRVHFSEFARWTGDSIHVADGAVFKPSIGSPDNWTGPSASWSQFTLNSLTADPGARLEIGGVSTLPASENVSSPPGFPQMITITDPDSDRSFVDILRINNALMEAHFEQAGLSDQYGLVIGMVRDLSTLDGVGDYADMYRRSAVSELERDMLDSIYARGGTESDKGFLQTVGGVIIQNSLLAAREHNANIASRIHRRLTAYQDEELENIPADLNDLETVTSESLADCYDECGDDGENFYNESWAFLDHGRSSQDDSGDMAAYAMNTTTLAIGHDWHADQWIYGGMLSYATGAMKLSNHGATKNEYDFLTAAAYISWAEDGWYLSGVGTATYGWNSAHSSYALPGLTLGSDADFATSALGLSLEAGHMLETEFYGIPLRITPYGGLTYSALSRDSVSDLGARDDALGINLQKQFRAADWNTWDAAIGLRLAVPMLVNDMTVVPSADISYSRTSGQPGPEGGVVHMYNNPANAWDLGLMNGNRGALRMTAGVEAEIREDISLGASYEFEWRKQYWNNRFNVNVSVDF